MQQNSHPELRLVRHAEIEKVRWDSVVQNAANCRIYALSWYLDRVSEGWDALIWGDYEFVMPLTWRRKWGMTYLVRPCYSQQHGIFPLAESQICKAFLIAVRENFRYVDISLNSQNVLPDSEEHNQMTNMLLNLNFPYNGLYAQYSMHTRRHLRKCTDLHLTFVEGILPGDYIDFKIRHQTRKVFHACLPVFKRLSSYLIFEGIGTFYGVYNLKNELCAAAYFVRQGKRLVYLNGVASADGKKVGAMFFLMDRIIQRFAGSSCFLDFEGSMIPGVARFFQGFGAQTEEYVHIHYNNLPAPWKWFKR